MDIFAIINVTAPAKGLSLFNNFSIPFKSGVELVTSAFFCGLPKITQASQVLLSTPINISVNYYYYYYYHHHHHHHSHHLIGSYKYLYYCYYFCNNNNNNQHSQYHGAISLSNSSAVRL